jgi:hypothetical protein
VSENLKQLRGVPVLGDALELVMPPQSMVTLSRKPL